MGMPFWMHLGGLCSQQAGGRKGNLYACNGDERFSIQNASSTETYSGTLTLEVKFVVDLGTANTGISFKKRHSLAALLNPETGRAGNP